MGIKVLMNLDYSVTTLQPTLKSTQYPTVQTIHAAIEMITMASPALVLLWENTVK